MCQIFFSDDYDGDSRSSHRCCGGTVHIKMATLFVATSALIVCAFNSVSMSFGIYSVNFELDIILIIANTITATMIFYGLYYEKPRLLIPFIVTSVHQILMTVSIFIGIIISTWSWIVAAKCHNYLKEQNQNSGAMMKERCLWR
ncbi:hypothetical protein X798_05289 [Onchocerca flexuosa]|uniref:Uncharacterized protein n=1 Tax=Onchocerca flexuosa TaxID=387005 RepID=A0A238BRW3_9BILA|nr:hypothetical protein X798_05289 [Onchocerca flexuosa]